MRSTYINTAAVPIAPDPPSVAASPLSVDAPGAVQDIDVLVAIDHTFVGDLALVLQAPTHEHVLLAAAEGGSRDAYAVIFDDAAQRSIAGAGGALQGRFRPAQPLSRLHGVPAAGEWRLIVVDGARGDGGELRAWALALETAEAAGPFEVRVRFNGGLTPTQETAFAAAAARWEAVIQQPLSPVTLGDGSSFGGVIIDARGVHLDGAGGVLGQAAPLYTRPDSGLPVVGFMEFDTGDLAAMEADGSLQNVIVHEMGHVLGIGTLWDHLLAGAGTGNPTFSGARARAEWANLGGTGQVPVENSGGAGTAGGHWRETVFGHELMTGWLGAGPQPLSEMTIAALEDLGYHCDRTQADPYALPSAGALAAMGIGSPDARRCHMCTRGRFPRAVPVPRGVRL